MKKSTVAAVMLSPFLSMLFCFAMWSQDLMVPRQLQERMHAIQIASRENEQRLHTYQWIETTTVTVDGNPKPPKQSICHYALDGTEVEVPLGPQQPPMPSGGPLMRHIKERKIEEVRDSLSQIRGLMTQYLPLGPVALQHAFQTRSVGFEHNGPLGNSVVIHDYAKPGDSLGLEIGAPGIGLRAINVRSYFEAPSDVLTAEVQFARLPDGTQYPSITTINAPEKRISITTVQSDFSRLVR